MARIGISARSQNRVRRRYYTKAVIELRRGASFLGCAVLGSYCMAVQHNKYILVAQGSLKNPRFRISRVM